VKNAPRKPMVLAIIAIFVLISPIYAESASNLEKYLDCSSEKKIDIAFVFDTTNSMGGEISELRATANKFATDLDASNIDYQLGLVEFRDFPETCDGFSCGSPGDYAYSVKGNGTLTSGIDTFGSWLKELKAGGGGSPGPEAVLAALRHAGSDLSWRIDAEKAIIVLTDAGAHPDGSCCNAEGDTLEGTIFELVDIGARAYIIGPEDASLEKIAENTGGQFYEIRSGLSLKPLLEEITKSLGCSFRTDVAASCENNQLDVSVQLIGKETIPYISGQTEAWMYLDQAGSISRFNLSYDQETEAYVSSVSDVCGSIELTVYGRAGERSAVQAVQVECDACGVASEPEEQGMLSISGRIYEDSNGDGTKSVDEAGLDAWEVLLLKPDSGSLAQQADRNGYYIFSGLLPGSYKVVANAQENWIAASPETGTKDVELIDVHESEIDFGFKQKQDMNQNKERKSIAVPNSPPTISEIYPEQARITVSSDYITLNMSGFNGGLDGNYALGEVVVYYILASDPDGDEILYRFFLNGEPTTDWQSQTDLWGTASKESSNPLDVQIRDAVEGSNQFEVQIRDGKHAGPNGWDDRVYASFNVINVTELSPPKAQSTDESALSVETLAESWQNVFGGTERDYGYSVQQTLDGGYIVIGNKADRGPWLIKTDSNGNELWDRTFSGGRTADDTIPVQQTQDGGYIFTAPYEGTDNEFRLIKTDSQGNQLWERTFSGRSVSGAASVRQIPDGGYIITGGTISDGIRSQADVWLIKTDDDGNKLWERTFGGEESDIGQSVQTTSGGYIITGWTESFGAGSRDLWLIKTDYDGNKLWDKTFGGSSSEKGWSVQQTTDGGYIIAGLTGSFGAGRTDLWLIKTDAEGNAPSVPENERPN